MKSTSRTELLLALALAATLLVLGLVFGAGRKDADDPRASAFVDSEHGLHALHLVLERVGANPHRSTSPPSATDPTGATLVVANPSEPVTKRETAQLVDWVKAGGRLVVIGGPAPVGAFQSYAEPLFDAFGLRRVELPPGSGQETHVVDASLSDGVGSVKWPATSAIVERAAPDGAGKTEPIVVAGSAWLAARRPLGDAGGEVVAVGDAQLLDNAHFANADNAVLAVRLVAARGAVVFDEFHHGFREGPGTDHLPKILLGMLVDTWPGRALLVLALAGLVHVAGAAVRLGAPEREAGRPRRALTEHAEALGRIFENVGARRESLSILAAGARRVAGPRTGIPTSLPPAEFLRRLRSVETDGAAEFADALEAAGSAVGSSRVDLQACKLEYSIVSPK